MKHRSRQHKFGKGQDANEMALRKLSRNFFRNSHLTTTEARAKAMKSHLDSLISKTREETESNKNFLLSKLADIRLVNTLFSQVGPAVKDFAGGYVKTTRLNQRENDGATMMKVEWAHPVVIDWEHSAAKSEKTAEKKDEVKADNKPVKEKKTTKKKTKSSETKK